MVRKATTEPQTQSPAQTYIAREKPGPRGPVPAPSRPTARGRTATANRLATRETALLAPDAAPTWSSDTEASTVAVRGATVSAIPRAKTVTPGSTPVRYPAPGTARTSRA